MMVVRWEGREKVEKPGGTGEDGDRLVCSVDTACSGWTGGWVETVGLGAAHDVDC